MTDILFKDYINLYKTIDKGEWIVLYEKNENQNLENDVFTFCALIDKDEVNNDDYMKKFDWGFATDSFGRSGFGTYGLGDKTELFFDDGTSYDGFEYLIALRYFEKYDTSIEINPKFIWYGNLVQQNDGYVDSLTDEVVIKKSACHIEVKREYLKDFLSAYNKVCVIVFDHRRHFNSNGEVKQKFENIVGDGYFITLSITDTRGYGNKFDSCSSIIGKALIMPFKKPHHRDYKYYTEDEKFETFIIGYDEEEDKTIEFTCNEKELANYFGANPESPHFLTPVFFELGVLDKYKNDSRNYEITDSSIFFLREWSIPFNINKERKVSVWLGDLGRIPYEEQKYWKAFNIRPEGSMDKKFVDRQIRGIWTDASRIESKLVPSLNRFNSVINQLYGDVIFKVLSDADKEIYNTFMIPTNYSIPEYQDFLMKLCKLTAESINTSLIKRKMGEEYDKDAKGKGSILQLDIFLKYTKIDINEKISTALKKAYNSRNKLAGHSASYGEYNKVWGRKVDFKFNSVEDARELIEGIISAIEYVIADFEVRKDEIAGS